jgi:hypothetical protein
MTEDAEYAKALVIWTLSFYIGIDDTEIPDEQVQSLEEIADAVWADPKTNTDDQFRMLAYALALAAEVIEMLADQTGEDPAVILARLTHEEGPPIQRAPEAG